MNAGNCPHLDVQLPALCDNAANHFAWRRRHGNDNLLSTGLTNDRFQLAQASEYRYASNALLLLFRIVVQEGHR